MKTKIRLPVSLTTAISTRARAYHTLRTEVSLNGEALAVRTLVKEANAGKFHYDMSVHAIDAVFDSANKKGRDESRPSCVAITNGGGTYPSRIARHQLGEQATTRHGPLASLANGADE